MGYPGFSRDPPPRSGDSPVEKNEDIYMLSGV